MAVARTAIMDPTVVLIAPTTPSPTEYDITSQVSSAEVTEEATVLERTTFGNTWKNKGRGLKSGSVKLDFYVDFDPDGVFETLTELWDSHEIVGFEITDPVTGAQVSGSFVMSQVPSFAGSVDEYNAASLTWETTGEITHTLGSES